MQTSIGGLRYNRLVWWPIKGLSSTDYNKGIIPNKNEYPSKIQTSISRARCGTVGREASLASRRLQRNAFNVETCSSYPGPLAPKY